MVWTNADFKLVKLLTSCTVHKQALVVGLEISNETYYLWLVQDLFQK